jgi:hypothetical protein
MTPSKLFRFGVSFDTFDTNTYNIDFPNTGVESNAYIQQVGVSGTTLAAAAGRLQLFGFSATSESFFAGVWGFSWEHDATNLDYNMNKICEEGNFTIDILLLLENGKYQIGITPSVDEEIKWVAYIDGVCAARRT